MEISGKYSNPKVFLGDYGIEEGTYRQVQYFADSKMTENEQVRIMPDCHVGAGCVIGYTQTYSGGPLDPDALGNDIGCSVVSVELKLKKSLDPDLIDYRVRKVIPMGPDHHKDKVLDERDFRKHMKHELERYRSLWPEMVNYEGLSKIDHLIEDTIKRLRIRPEVFYNSLGTLGGGEAIK